MYVKEFLGGCLDPNLRSSIIVPICSYTQRERLSLLNAHTNTYTHTGTHTHSEEVQDGYRDVQLSVAFTGGLGLRIIGEIQVRCLKGHENFGIISPTEHER